MPEDTAARCPYCMKDSVKVQLFFEDGEDRVHAGRCAECSRLVVRVNNKVVYPLPGPSVSLEDFEGLPEELRNLCVEACSVAEVSPRAACSLLAPHVERICDHVGADGETLAEKLDSLHKAGKLPDELGRSLAAAAAKTDQEEIEEARRQFYDLNRVARYLAPHTGDFWPST